MRAHSPARTSRATSPCSCRREAARRVTISAAPWIRSPGRLVAATALDDPERATAHRGAVRAASRRSSSACSGEKSRNMRCAAAAAGRFDRVGGNGSGPVGHAEQCGQRGETDEFDSASSTPSSAASSRTVSQTSHIGVTEIEQVHRDLGPPELGDPETEAWTFGRPPLDSRTRRRCA